MPAPTLSQTLKDVRDTGQLLHIGRRLDQLAAQLERIHVDLGALRRAVRAPMVRRRTSLRAAG